MKKFSDLQNGILATNKKLRKVGNDGGRNDEEGNAICSFDLREGKVRMEQMNLLHSSAPANPSSLAKRDARG